MIRSIVRFFSNNALAREASRAKKEIADLNNYAAQKQAELHHEKEMLNEQFSARVRELRAVLEEDKQFFREFYPLFTDYVRVYRDREYVSMARKACKLQLDELYQKKQELKDWASSLTEDLQQLEEARQAIQQLTDTSGHLELACSQDPNLAIYLESGLEAGASKQVILERYRDEFEQDSPEYQALNNLVSITARESRFADELKRINWAMSCLSTIRRNLVQGIRDINTAIADIKQTLADMREEYNAFQARLVSIGRKVHGLWQNPMDSLQEEIDDVSEDMNTARSNLNYYKSKVKECHDTEDYSYFDRYKEQRGLAFTRLRRLGDYKHELIEQKKQWQGRKRLVFDRLKEQQIYLEGGRKRESYAR